MRESLYKNTNYCWDIYFFKVFKIRIWVVNSSTLQHCTVSCIIVLRAYNIASVKKKNYSWQLQMTTSYNSFFSQSYNGFLLHFYRFGYAEILTQSFHVLCDSDLCPYMVIN